MFPSDSTISLTWWTSDALQWTLFSTNPTFHSQGDGVGTACGSRSRVLPFNHHPIPHSVALSIRSSPLPNPSQRAGCQAEAASDCSMPVSPNRQAGTTCSDRLWWTKWTAPAWFGSVARIGHGIIDSLGSESPGLASACWLRFFRRKIFSYSFFPCRSMYPTSDQRSNTSIFAFGQPWSLAMWRNAPILRIRRSSCFLGFSILSWKTSSLSSSCESVSWSESCRRHCPPLTFSFRERRD